jgi:hypothetical protein
MTNSINQELTGKIETAHRYLREFLEADVLNGLTDSQCVRLHMNVSRNWAQAISLPDSIAAITCTIVAPCTCAIVLTASFPMIFTASIWALFMMRLAFVY